MLKQIPAYVILCVWFFALSACGGGSSSSSVSSSSSSSGSSSSSSSGTTANYTVGGTITGLTGTGLILKDTTNSHQVTVAAHATTFTITPAITSGTHYAVTVLAQPTSPSQTCTITSGATGSVTTAAVTSVVVACTTNTYTVGGTVTGLMGSGLVVKDTTNGNQATVPANATSFTITPAVDSGAAYNVTVLTQPTNPSQSCVVSSGAAGTVGAGAVHSVAITCTTGTFTVGGTISGLTGTGLVLKDTVNAHQTGAITAAATTFTITPGVASGGTYAVSVLTQPSTPAQFCRVTGGTGNITTANVTSVAVACTNVGQVVFVANPYDSGGTGTLASFTIDPATGALAAANGTPLLPATAAAADDNPTGLALDPSGSFLYVANAGTNVPGPPFVGNDVATWAINADGTFGTEGAPVTISTTNQPAGLAIDPAAGGPFLYVGSNDIPNGGVEGFNPVAGVLTGHQLAVPPTVGNVANTLVVDSTQQFLFTPFYNDGTIGVSAIGVGGIPTPITGSPFGGLLADPYAVAASPNGQFIYVTDTLTVPGTTPGTVTQFSYDNTGALTMVGTPIAVGTNPYGIAIDPSGQFLYVSNGDGTLSGFTVAPTTGVLTSMGAAVPTGASAVVNTTTSLAIDPSSQYLYVTTGDAATNGSSIIVFTITPVTGVPVVSGTPVQATNLGGAGTTAIVVK